MTRPIADMLLSGKLFTDEEIEQILSPDNMCRLFMCFERALVQALALENQIDNNDAEILLAKLENFQPDLDQIRQAAHRDGLPIPEFVRQGRAHIGPELAPHFHFAATSQDVIDTALMMAFEQINIILLKRFDRLIARLEELSSHFGSRPLMARTRMQAARPILLSVRIQNWLAPLQDCRAQLSAQTKHMHLLQFGGPVGSWDQLASAGPAVAIRLAALLGLTCPARPWHTQRAPMVQYGQLLSLASGALGKIGQDICLMAQQGIDEIAFSNAGISSAMPDKKNPVLAEILVTAARYGATLTGGLHHTLIHEQERSGAAWTLEWMILPDLCIIAGSGLQNAVRLIDSITSIGLGAEPS